MAAVVLRQIHTLQTIAAATALFEPRMQHNRLRRGPAILARLLEVEMSGGSENLSRIEDVVRIKRLLEHAHHGDFLRGPA